MVNGVEERAYTGRWESDLASGETRWSAGIYRMLGTRPDTAPLDHRQVLSAVHPYDRGRIDALRRSVREHPELVPEGGMTFGCRIVREDGVVREALASGHVVPDETGRPARWVGVVRDVTDERLTEGELLAHLAVGRALRERQPFDDRATALLRGLGTALGYRTGAIWLRDPSEQTLVFRTLWSAYEPVADGFEQALRAMTVRPGAGASPIAWCAQEPAIIADVASDDGFEPLAAARAAGITSAIRLPAAGTDGPVALLSFYAHTWRSPSDSLLRTLTAIGCDLGHFFSRQQGQRACGRLTERELEILHLTAHGNSGPRIAQLLFIMPSTVKSHLEHIYAKLGVSDRAAAVAIALRTGLID
jgi:DNA-binding CsgD family transcriptional regulator